ncbi:hypothetical protein [Methylobacterium hispanicum]|uniref:hypothetical protein n=1 Tax=Methylobacterium hispanicum TaxID=270350 RepID=UPI002F3607D5
MPITQAELEAVVAELARRPGHEKVRALLHRLLTGALGARSEQIAFEQALPEVRGRVDALLGRTLIEIKADLRRESAAAEAHTKSVTRSLRLGTTLLEETTTAVSLVSRQT